MPSLQQLIQKALQRPQPQPTSKVFIVASHTGCLVGIEQLIIMHVSPASVPIFLKEYAGRIIIEGNSAEEVRAKLFEVPGK